MQKNLLAANDYFSLEEGASALNSTAFVRDFKPPAVNVMNTGAGSTTMQSRLKPTASLPIELLPVKINSSPFQQAQANQSSESDSLNAMSSELQMMSQNAGD